MTPMTIKVGSLAIPANSPVGTVITSMRTVDQTGATVNVSFAIGDDRSIFSVSGTNLVLKAIPSGILPGYYAVDIIASAVGSSPYVVDEASFVVKLS
jgi:hypothetical protein